MGTSKDVLVQGRAHSRAAVEHEHTTKGQAKLSITHAGGRRPSGSGHAEHTWGLKRKRCTKGSRTPGSRQDTSTKSPPARSTRATCCSASAARPQSRSPVHLACPARAATERLTVRPHGRLPGAAAAGVAAGDVNVNNLLSYKNKVPPALSARHHLQRTQPALYSTCW